MTIDLAHAPVAGVHIVAAILGMERVGPYVRHQDGEPRWSWPLFVAIAAAVFGLNPLWP